MKQILVFILALAASHICLANGWTWRGVELIGNRSVDCKDLLRSVPIKIGDPYKEEIEGWQRLGRELKQTYGFSFTLVGAVRYSNFDAFLVVEVVEKGDEARVQFRKLGDKSVELATPKIVGIYQQLQKRLWELFDQGKPPKENFEKKFLDWNDDEMHRLALQLSELVPPLRDNLLLVLRYDPDDQKRTIAADLLNYSMGDLQTTADLAVALLDDPNSSVRNNISRFTFHFPKLIKSEEVRNRMIDAFAIQLTRPSHADRNKAIVNLLLLGQKFPESLPYIQKRTGEWVKLLAERSVLSNVQGPAVELQELILKFSTKVFRTN